MTESTTGLIVRTRPLTETSLIVHWLTPELGRVATVAKGARRSKSPFAGKLDLFYRADFSFNRGRSTNLHMLREVKLLETHGAIREDMLKLQQAAYAAAFVEQATETDTPLPEIFELIHGFIKHLCLKQPQPHSIFALELKLLRELGMAPAFEETQLSAGTKKIGRSLVEGSWKNVARLKLSVSQTGELHKFLHGFLIFHLGRLPRGRAAALAENIGSAGH